MVAQSLPADLSASSACLAGADLPEDLRARLAELESLQAQLGASRDLPADVSLDRIVSLCHDLRNQLHRHQLAASLRAAYVHRAG